MSARISLPLFVLFTSLLIWSQSQGAASATAPDYSGEGYVFERLNELVRFENDGSGVRETSAVIRIQSQAGVQEFGQLVFGYSTANEDLAVDYVRVRRSDGQVVNTPTSAAQDFAPETLREAPMYSDYREHHISVVDLQPGVTLEYHVIVHVKPLAPGQFWYEHSFPEQQAIASGTFEINLPKSREVKLKSPDHKYETREDGDRRIYTWAVKNLVPDRNKREGEEEQEEGDTADIQLSSFTDWQQVAVWYAKLQSEKAVPDEPIKAKAAELTKDAGTADEKARRLYDYVAQNIRYVSLSFGVGRYQPHAASEVFRNGYGDCKDKHTLLQAMLAAQGIESYPVLINFGSKIDPDVPSPAQFNHLITEAKVRGTFKWLDSTSEVAPYGLIAYQLRNRQAVVASIDSAGGLRRTPAESPLKNLTSFSENAKVNELGALDADIELTASGDNDWYWRAVFRELPQADWPRALERFSQLFGIGGDVSDVHVDSLKDTTKPIHLTYHLHKSDYFKVPSSAVNFQPLPPSSLGRVPKPSKKHPGDPLDVGPAGENLFQAHVVFPANFTVHIPADVSITRDYGEYSTSYKLSGNTLDAQRRMVLKVNEVPALRRADFTSFHVVTTSAVEETPWCSIARPSAASLASAAEMKGAPSQLREAGIAALKRQDFATASALLQRATDQDPNGKEGWEELGQAYAGLNQHEKAAQAFQKQIEKDPGHPHANGELAAELAQLGRFDDAAAAYRKQIEIAPSEKLAHKQLGLLLMQLNRDSEAQGELEAAAAIPPDDPQVKMALAQLYSRAGENKKAEVIMSTLTGGSVTTVKDDFFSPALRDDVDSAQAAHDAEKNLSDIGDQFESGEYDHLDANSFSIMDVVALSWARMGWARFLQGDNIVASQYLDAAWQLSQSGTVANRLARVYEKTGARDRAQHMYALAAVAGGPDAQNSRDQVTKLNPANAEKSMAEAHTELQKMRVIRLPKLTSQPASAQIVLSFDNSTNPDRIQFLEGDDSLRDKLDDLQKVDFPLKFPDVSSVKIIRTGKISCTGDACSIALLPLNNMRTKTATVQANDAGPGGSRDTASKPATVNPNSAIFSKVETGQTASSTAADKPPHLITSPDPDYPDAARRAKVQGVVVVQCVVGADGRVRQARIYKSLRPDLDASALEAVRQWQFDPATKDGKPVEVQVNVEVNFHLYKDVPGI